MTTNTSVSEPCLCLMTWSNFGHPLFFLFLLTFFLLFHFPMCMVYMCVCMLFICIHMCLHVETRDSHEPVTCSSILFIQTGPLNQTQTSPMWLLCLASLLWHPLVSLCLLGLGLHLHEFCGSRPWTSCLQRKHCKHGATSPDLPPTQLFISVFKDFSKQFRGQMMRQILVLVCGMSEKKVHICYPIQYTLQFFGGAAALHGLCYITVTEDPAA